VYYENTGCTGQPYLEARHATFVVVAAAGLLSTPPTPKRFFAATIAPVCSTCGQGSRWTSGQCETGPFSQPLALVPAQDVTTLLGYPETLPAPLRVAPMAP
jgi:hypothetical protein